MTYAQDYKKCNLYKKINIYVKKINLNFYIIMKGVIIGRCLQT